MIDKEILEINAKGLVKPWKASPVRVRVSDSSDSVIVNLVKPD